LILNFETLASIIHSMHETNFVFMISSIRKLEFRSQMSAKLECGLISRPIASHYTFPVVSFNSSRLYTNIYGLPFILDLPLS
jgi:hypothetical protein